MQDCAEQIARPGHCCPDGGCGSDNRVWVDRFYFVSYNHDLYNLVYGNSRPIKGENTYQFLSVFPGLLWLQGLLLWFDPTRQLVRRCQDDAMMAVIVLSNAAGALLFCVIAIMRIVTVWRWHFLSPMSALH